VLDMYEHAYHMDFGAKAVAYVDAYMESHPLGECGEAPRALQPRKPKTARNHRPRMNREDALCKSRDNRG